MKSMSDQSLDKNELTLQNFIVYGFERTKLNSMIYGVSKSKGGGIKFYQKPYNPRIDVLIKPSDPSSSSTYQKGLNAYFILVVENGKIMNQLEVVINNSQVILCEVPRGSEVKVKAYSRQNVSRQKVWNESKPYYKAKAQGKKKPYKS